MSIYLLHIPTGEYVYINGLVTEPLTLIPNEHVIFSVETEVTSVELKVSEVVDYSAWWEIHVLNQYHKTCNVPAEYFKQAVTAATLRQLDNGNNK